MKIVKKNVYYCEYCKKRGLSAYYLRKHEIRCTANPNRSCGICNTTDGASPNIGEIVEELKKRVSIYKVEGDFGYEEMACKWIGEPVTIEEIRTLANGCPNCMLSILRQTKLNYEVAGIKFDYKAEFDIAMKEVSRIKNEEAQRAETWF